MHGCGQGLPKSVMGCDRGIGGDSSYYFSLLFVFSTFRDSRMFEKKDGSLMVLLLTPNLKPDD